SPPPRPDRSGTARCSSCRSRSRCGSGPASGAKTPSSADGPLAAGGLPSAADLLDPQGPASAGLERLGALGFADPAGALGDLRRLAEAPRERERVLALLPRLLHHLQASPDPDMALNNLERLAAAALDRVAFYTLLGDHPEAIPIVVTLGAQSQFLADALVRSPQTFPWLLDPRTMKVRSREAMREEIASACRPFRTAEAREHALRRVKRRELCRIGTRDVLGDADLVVTTQELSELADACLEEAWAIALPGLLERYGSPRPAGFAVIALRELGGRELNYSSDTHLCFLYQAEGETTGPAAPAGLPTRTARPGGAGALPPRPPRRGEGGAASRAAPRLRPGGPAGPLPLPLAAYRQYHESRGALWERQALIKARFAAGDPR